jgi:hypothetical protein
MPTPKEFRKNAEDCLRLARESNDINARLALIEMATEYATQENGTGHEKRAAGAGGSKCETGRCQGPEDGWTPPLMIEKP